MDGIEATQLITAGDTRARVLILTTFDDDDYVHGALRAGASGFLVKDMALVHILTAIRVVAAGDAIIIAPGVTRRLIGQFTRPARSDRKPLELTGITGRERKVLRLLGLGMSNAEIAAALYITVGHRQDSPGPAAGQAGRQGPRTARHRSADTWRLKSPGDTGAPGSDSTLISRVLPGD